MKPTRFMTAMTSRVTTSNADSSQTTPMPRRSALKLLGGALALPALTATTVAAEKQPIWKTAVGLNGFQSGSRKYKKNYPIWEVLDFASRRGFDGVELVGDWPSGGYPAANDKERVQALRRLYDQYGLRIFSIQLGADGAFDPDAAARERWLNQFRDRIQLAKQLGCDCVGMWPGGGLRGQTIDQALERLAKSFHEAGKIAGDAGLRACFEIEPVFVFNKEEHYLRILHGADHPALKGIYDPSHFDQMNGATGPRRCSRASARRTSATCSSATPTAHCAMAARPSTWVAVTAALIARSLCGCSRTAAFAAGSWWTRGKFPTPTMRASSASG